MSPKKSKLRTPNEQMHEDLPLGESPPRSKHAQGLSSPFYTEEHDICDGQVKILRTRDSGQVYQFRSWIPQEKKYVKKSLRTKDLKEAKEKGRKLFYSMMGIIDAGQKIFSITAEELVKKYLEYQQDRVDGGFITEGRRTTINTQCKHFLDFVGKNRKLDTITKEKYKDYYSFRRRKHPNVQDVTLVNERATLGNMYKFALEKGYINQNRIPVWTELKRVHPNSRTAFTREAYRKLYTYLKNWDKKIENEKEIYNRKLIRDFILIQSNTGLRFGECRYLKWNYVTIKKSSGKYPNVLIKLPKEITKTRTARTAVGMRGDFFKRIKTYSEFTHNQDYVFADMTTGEPIGKKLLYKLWKVIMKESGLDEYPEDYSYYCLRHTFATYRLQYGKIDIRTLAKVMGCSVRYIELHYDSAKVEDMTDYITRNLERKDAIDEVIIN